MAVAREDTRLLGLCMPGEGAGGQETRSNEECAAAAFTCWLPTTWTHVPGCIAFVATCGAHS